MKHAKIIITILITTLTSTLLHAQDIDQNRMQRDINIMESVLGEMFKTEWTTEDGTGTLNNVRIHQNGLSWSSNRSSNVKGSYFTDYGVIFIITNTKPVILKLSQNNNTTGYFQRGSSTARGKVEINRESIIDGISEFLMDYGPTIKQLKPNDKVTVVYKSNNGGQFLTIIRSDSLNNNKVDRESAPSLSVSAAVHDIQAYRKGDLTETSFRNRLQINDVNPEDDSERRMRVMSKILQTTFDDDQSDNFEIDDLNHMYIDGFGAIFKGRASYGSGYFGFGIDFSKPRMRIKQLADKYNIDSLKVSIRDGNFSWSSDKDGWEEKSPEEMKESYDRFIALLKETIIDYGQTLSSVQPDENILVALSISAGDELPDRADLRIKKSVPERAGQGQISREQAIDAITVREY